MKLILLIGGAVVCPDPDPDPLAHGICILYQWCDFGNQPESSSTVIAFDRVVSH